MGYIYLITNMINGNKYVGQSKCQDIEQRWKYHKQMRECSIGRYLLNAYRHHGIENFKFQIICICFDEDCNKYEEEYIMKFNTLSPNGYNLKGGGHFTKHHTDTKVLMSQRTKEMMTPEHRAYLSNKLKTVFRSNRGNHLSQEIKNKIGVSIRKFWESKSKDERKEIVHKRNISKQSNPNTATFLLSENARKALELGCIKQSKKVAKLSSSGEILETYPSISEAARANNLANSTITRVCMQKPRCKTAGGYIWKYM